MNFDTILEVRDLHKVFTLNHSGAASLKTAMLWWKNRGIEKLHVLKGVSFDVKRGECVAVVGRNGAGKSTLLSLIANIYRPTSGTVKVNGRIAPLLELGAGFHPDLTGIENIFFNGTVLGLTRRQIEERIDSIIEFSELQGHIDTPVRTYSSGMTARLGFAIAMHVDADMLLVDEVLAVGDFEFQIKCQNKIADYKAKGGTILLVSHNGEDIERIADRCVWLQAGQVQMVGAPKEVMKAYESGSTSDLLRVPDQAT